MEDRDAGVATAAYEAWVKLAGKEKAEPHLAALNTTHPALREKWLGPEETQRRLGAARGALEAIEGPWTVDAVEAALSGLLEAEEIKPGKLYQPLRVALAGTTVSPGIFETVAVLGRVETLARIDGATSGLKRPSEVADRG